MEDESHLFSYRAWSRFTACQGFWCPYLSNEYKRLPRANPGSRWTDLYMLLLQIPTAVGLAPAWMAWEFRAAAGTVAGSRSQGCISFAAGAGACIGGGYLSVLQCPWGPPWPLHVSATPYRALPPKPSELGNDS